MAVEANGQGGERQVHSIARLLRKLSATTSPRLPKFIPGLSDASEQCTEQDEQCPAFIWAA